MKILSCLGKIKRKWFGEFLSPNELSRLKRYEFPLESQDRLRDLFVFNCYTGISLVEGMKLTLANSSMGVDRTNWIFTKQKKTRTPVKVPFPNPVSGLIKKYANHRLTLIPVPLARPRNQKRRLLI